MNEKKAFNYRHIICIAITFGFIACILLFPSSPLRLVESLRDFGLSFAYYFCEVFDIEYSFVPTVVEFSSIPSSPFIPIADNWEEFVIDWNKYWQIFTTKENLINYRLFVVFSLERFSKILLIIFPFIFLLFILLRQYLSVQNNDYDKDSKPLQIFKKLSAKTYRPIKAWCISFYEFVCSHRYYLKIWLCIWLLYFNVISIVIEIWAFYVYFVISFDVLNIYRQVYKLFIDLSAVVFFVPVWAWIIIGITVLEIICRKIAYNRLNHRERCNRGFINERGVVTLVVGAMGAGKTMQITDMALSSEVQFRDSAFEIILETDMKFPYFPWIILENSLKEKIENHDVYDLPSCRKWIRNACIEFEKSPCRENIFGYDFDLYGLMYDDKLKLTYIWQALEYYACAYFIYVVQSSLLISNYSVRTDMLFSDLGNFPLWNADFFKRDSRLIDSYSRHAHILDFDMLRLGKKMLENNPTRNAFGFGVYIISEIDKERKNTPELKEVKASANECNQKNDLFNVLLKMSRHACVVANRVFIKIYADLQRPTSLGADARELGEIVEIKSKGENTLALPFFSPFNLFELIFNLLSSVFDGWYVQYRYNRSDNTLILYCLKTITAKLKHYHERMINTFGSQVLTLEVENGAREGDVKLCKYYRQSKKIYSNRYSTDCLSGLFAQRAEVNTVGLDDMQEYADIMACNDELARQNSHFQSEIKKLNEEKL